LRKIVSQFLCVFVFSFLSTLFTSAAQADFTLEHVDGPDYLVNEGVMLSGDGQWFSQSAKQNASAWLTTWNLDSADENAVDLAVTTGIDGLSFDNDVSPDANFDGSSTAIVARSGSYRDLAMVVSPAGIEIARMSGPDEYGSEAWFEIWLPSNPVVPNFKTTRMHWASLMEVAMCCLNPPQPICQAPPGRCKSICEI
jgi:hypothetical protein